MKKTLLSLLSCAAISSLFAQQNPDCIGNRFKETYFPEVEETRNVQYGQAPQLLDIVGPSVTANPFDQVLRPVLIQQNLMFDFYEPAGDKMQERPLIIFAFGGAFVFGSRRDNYVVDLCIRYAKLGYAVASIDYRLTREISLAATKLDPGVAPKAVLKGTHDMKAAIRFFRNSYFNGNPYRIDEKQIYAAGLSAGAFCATHAAYLREEEEIPEVIYEHTMENGGVEGNSGTPGVSSAVAGVISMSGALGEASWMDAGDVPIVSTHGTADNVVPYGADSVTILGINYPVDGSSVIHQRSEQLNIPNAFYTYVGASHAPESMNAAYRDTGFAFTRDFMYEMVCNYLSTKVEQLDANSWSLYPNPAKEVIHINGIYDNAIAVIHDITGREILRKTLHSNNESLPIGTLKNGVYQVSILQENKEIARKKFIKE